jgi:hypothetical protein
MPPFVFDDIFPEQHALSSNSSLCLLCSVLGFHFGLSNGTIAFAEFFA